MGFWFFFRTLEDSIGKPIFVLLRNVVELGEYDQRRNSLNALLADMSACQPKIGYLLLYYIEASTYSDEAESSGDSDVDKMQPYVEFCDHMDKRLEDCLLNDLKVRTPSFQLKMYHN